MDAFLSLVRGFARRDAAPAMHRQLNADSITVQDKPARIANRVVGASLHQPLRPRLACLPHTEPPHRPPGQRPADTAAVSLQ